MKITSPAFQNNEKIPAKYTCNGEQINPPLKIEGVPETAKSLTLIVDDPDAPAGTFVHWIVFNIDPKTTEIPKNSVPENAIQGKSSLGTSSYVAPCPPSGSHRYFFKLYALDSELSLNNTADKTAVETAMQNQILAQTELIGLYNQ